MGSPVCLCLTRRPFGQRPHPAHSRKLRPSMEWAMRGLWCRFALRDPHSLSTHTCAIAIAPCPDALA